MVLPMIIGAATSVASSAASSSKVSAPTNAANLGPTSQSGVPINIAPQGINLGSILQPFLTEPASGGPGMNIEYSGLDGFSPFGSRAAIRIGPANDSGDPTPWYVAGAIALALGGFYLYRRA